MKTSHIKRLVNAVQEGDIPELEKLYSAGIDLSDSISILEISSVRLRKKSALQWDRRRFGKKHARALEWLVCHGANVNSWNKRGETPLMVASFAEDCYLADTLIQLGADVNARGADGCTCLHKLTYFPMSSNRKKMLRLLFGAGADATIANHDNNTSLHFVSDLPVANLLIKNGAKLDVVNNDGLRPEDTIRTYYPVLADKLCKLRLEEEKKFICQGLPTATAKPSPRARM